RRVVRVEAGEDAQQRRGVGHRPRHRAGGVLAGGDRHDPVAADEPERGLDADDHVLAGRAEDRARRLSSDADRGEVVADGDAGTEPAVVGMSRVAMLSLTMTGMPNSGPPALGLSLLASRRACGLTRM